MNVIINGVICISGISMFIFALIHHKVGGLKGWLMAMLLAVGGLAALIGAMFLFGPVGTGIVVLGAACGFIPALCLYNIINYLRLKKHGGRSEGDLLYWGFSSKMHPYDCPVISYVSNDGEQRSFKFKNNIFLTEKRCLKGVDIIFDNKRPYKAYVEKYSLMTYIVGFIIFVPLFVMDVKFSILTLQGAVM